MKGFPMVHLGRAALVWLLVMGMAACSTSDGGDTEPTVGEDATTEELDELLAGYPAGASKADDVTGLYYQLRDGRTVFLGDVAEELVTLGVAHPETSQVTTRRGVTYTLSPFAYCVQQGTDSVCVSHLGRTWADDQYALIFGGALRRRLSVPAYKARELTAAMVASGAEASDLGNGYSYHAGTWFGCVSGAAEVYCGLYQEANKGAQTTTRVEVSFTDLPELGPDFVYEGWLIIDGAPVSAGRFDNQAGFSAFTFEFLADVSDAVAYILTIEPRIGDDPAPSDVHLLGGEFVDGAAQLSMTHPGALGTDFSEASGDFILAVPSDPTAPYSQGVWFVNPAEGAPSLNLPELPAGWTYEGWAVGADGPVSTGLFRDVAGADSDGAGPYAGPQPGPPFPGQDFVTPPMDLIGAPIVISVEPVPDTDPAPFALKPLVGEGADVGAGVLQPLSPNLGGQPSGVATLTLSERAFDADAVVVANRAEGTVSVLDAEEGHLLKNVALPSGGEPMYVNHSRAAGRIFIGDRGNDQVVVLDDRTYEIVGAVPAAAGVFHMWANPDGGALYVNADVDKVVVVINTETLEQERVFELPADLTAGAGKPHDVVADPDGRSIYVSFVGVEGGMDAIIKLNTRSGREMARIMVEPDPHVSASFRNGLLFAPVQDGDAVYVLNRDDLSVVERLDVAGAHGAGMALDGSTFFATGISGGGANGLVAIDGDSPAVVGTADTPYAVPHNVIANAGADLVFVTHSGGASDKVSVFSYDGAGGFTLVSDVNTGANPFGIGLVAPSH